MEEAVSGVKGELATKVYGDDLHVLEDEANRVAAVMSHVRGIADLGVLKVTGQPDLDYVVEPSGGRTLADQRGGYSGRYSDRGRRHRSYAGSARRTGLQPHIALSCRNTEIPGKRSTISVYFRLRASGFHWLSSAP